MVLRFDEDLDVTANYQWRSYLNKSNGKIIRYFNEICHT